MDRSKIKLIQGPEGWVHAVRTIEATGCSTREAELLAARSVSVVVAIAGSLPTPVAKRSRREGLVVWSVADETYMAGCVAGFQALLQRWPGEPSLGERLAGNLGLSWQERREMRWPGRTPAGWGDRPVLMGIMNLTPDSFSDGGSLPTLEKAVARAVAMVEEGADMIDVGGESTRPGADPVSLADEIARVAPAIQAIAKVVPVPISIDTYKPEVAEAAIKAGAAMINDITGLSDPAMAELAARTDVPTVVMHMRGTPRTMQHTPPTYSAVVADVIEWLDKACTQARAVGVQPEQLVVDPGIGFGKTVAHNLELLARLRDLRCLGYPVLLGTSRKSVIGNVLGLPVDQREEGTAATTALAADAAVEIIRVHNVKAMRRVLDMAEAIVSANRTDINHGG